MDQPTSTWPPGGGDMGERMRCTDWSASPLGPVGRWPQSLRTAVEILLETRHGMMLAWGPELTLFYNDAYAPFLGLKHPAALGQPFAVAWADIWADIAPLVAQALSGEAVRFEDYHLVMERNGYPEDTWWSFTYSPVRDETDAVVGMLNVTMDTTGKVLALREAALERERQRLMLQQMPGFAGMMSGPEHRYDYVNDAYVEISGGRTFVGRTIREVFPEVEGQGYFELLDEVYATGERFEARAMPVRLDRADGERFVDLLFEPVRAGDGAVIGIFVGGYDITDRVRAERALRDSEARLRLLDAIGAATAPLLDAGDILAVTTRLVGEHMGVSNCAYADMDEDEDGFTIRGDWAAPGSPSIVGHYSLADFGSLAVENLRTGQPLVVNDNLRELALEAAATFQAIGIGATICMPLVKDGRLTALMAIHQRGPHDWTDGELALIREVTERSWAHVERAGAAAELRASAAALSALNATLEQRVAERTAELTQAHEALRQAQKMEAVGQLTGGLAHDFNNLLAGISGSLELMQMRLSQGRTGEIDRYLVAAQGAARRAAALTHRLLAFSRRQTLDPKATDMNRLVRDMEELIRRTVGPSIRVETRAAEDLPPTLVDPHQLENALLNLCINARDAMPEGGLLAIATSHRRFDERAAREHDVPPGDYVSMCVRDDGTGMTPEVVERAFDPFFTTKPIGVGTGLGLSMIYGFVRQSGGAVQIDSRVGQGTTVCIHLPRHLGAAAPAPEPGTPAPAVERATAGLGVLVVDDEPFVRMIVVDVLEELGYLALEAEDGPSALAVLRSPARIDLLITDVGLPNGMNGRQVADAAREVRPGLKVLFVTGYAETAVLSHGHLSDGMQIVTKPFDMKVLTERIEAMIAGG